MKVRFKAWAVLERVERRLVPFGNGKQFQLPIFHTRAEAKEWVRDMPDSRGRIVRCEIALEEGRHA